MKLRMTAVAVMGVLASNASLAAEQANNEQVERIEVTGTRGSLIKSKDLKRDSDSIVDAIVASEIGEFPDHNIADSLQRLTGIQIDRERGTAARVSIRGLPSKFTKVLYNGHSISSIAVGDVPLREFSFNSLPSDFASSIVVNKSSTADLPEGGLAGTVDLRTHRAFDSDKAIYLLSGKGVYDQKSEDYSPEVTGLWSDTFADGFFGVTLGVNYVEQNQGVQRTRTGGPGLRKEGSDDVDYNQDGDTADSIALVKPIRYEDFPINRERTSGIANIEFRPNDDFRVFGELFYSKLDVKANRHSLIVDTRKYPYVDGSAPELTEYMVEDESYQYVDAAYLQQVKASTQTQGQLRNGDMLVGVLEAQYTVNDWTIAPSASFTKSSTSLTKWNINSSSHITDAPAYEIAATADEASRVLFDDPSELTNIDNFDWSKAPMSDFYRDVNNSTMNLRLNVDKALDWQLDEGGVTFTNIAFGVNYSEDKVKSDGAELEFSNQNPFDILGISKEEYFVEVEHDTAGAFLAPDTLKVLEDFSPEALKAAGKFTYDEASQIDLEEDSWSAFTRVDFYTGEGDFSGNLGVRYVQTNERVAGYTGNPNAGFTMVDGTLEFNQPPAQVQRDRTYKEWLPSLNFRYDVADNHSLRLAANKTLTRADYDALSIYINAREGVDENRLNYSDPNIQPWLANNVDLAYEWYFDEEGMFSTTLFYKDIKSLNGRVERNEQFPVTAPVVNEETGAPSLDGSGQPILATNLEDFYVTGISNVRGAELKGAEVALQMPLSFLPSFLSDLGLNTNYTYIDNSAPERVVAASKHNYNAMLYYSIPGFNAKVSYTYRDKFLRELADGEVPEVMNAPRGNLSASISYKPLKFLTIRLNGSNLTGEADSRYFNGINWNNQFIDYGRRFTLGVKVKF
ncbi:TonB-dependent receptor [Paraferrimonas sp. SM1919]|uniref:TonB-dependent receptor n=1 Tax=Paraferrimonas sp. SM1919 TaxID=2662263 RepID=UPI0013D2B843|nr:TonB-dependent receptor [Paraferrimonas sp. SM1919]